MKAWSFFHKVHSDKLMSQERPLLYFEDANAWRNWLRDHYGTYTGVYLVFYKVTSEKASMRWEEAVQVALCYGWIDSTVKKIDEERRKQLFTPRKPKSVWSALNKKYITSLIAEGLMHQSGLDKINAAKKDGSWKALDDVENLIIPEDLQQAFNNNPTAFKNYNAFSKTYKKSYLYWLNSAKRTATREKRIEEIIKLCNANQKSR